MIKKSLTALVLVVMLMLGGLIFFMQHNASMGPLFNGPGMLLTDQQQKNLSRADEIRYGDILLQRKGDQWYLANGIMADPMVVASLLGELANAQLVRRLTQNQDLWGKLGLDSEAVGLLVRAEGKDVFRLDLGDVTKEGPTGRGGQYVVVGGFAHRMEPPLLVPNQPMNWARVKPESLPMLADIQVVDVHRVGEGHVSFAQNAGRLVPQNLPLQWQVNENLVARLAQSLSALDFSGLRLAGEGRLVARLDLFLNQAGHWMLEVVNDGSSHYLAITPPSDHAMADDLKKLWLEFPQTRFDIWMAGRAGFIQAP
ncbi:MAG TPA: hypothetical protein DHV03_04825 [Alphaproteobacteria bacterium]|jgi:hypothetical protein|nr:hypothetical protein [Paracoccaceae bacterium]RCL81053.1 MAG: hypothetical protein DBW67_02250 [SAR116 cluster bacterium]RPH13775.1 MAG: hypothetical protein CBD10_003215 [Alphaproteobacteria bacterium TMED150]HBQ23571.1 hypothetical protein [Alphaproteobacteria bacterium]HCY47986.1 hypothetical protein [Alphaproteobacteria bacterium]|tara:strand:- start:1587 stop:2522 length:936 start_codon:yes stop_codon:yes gene_type:complete